MSKNNSGPAEPKRMGVVGQKQKGYFALRLHVVGGDFTSEQMEKVARVAKRFGKGQIHLTTRQGVEIHWVASGDIEPARQELASAGIAMGAGGPRVRIIAACPGKATCRWGIIDTKSVARRLDRTYFGQDMPHKFKLAVTGCPHNCAKASENDIGVMGGIEPHWDGDQCTDCGLCVSVCPTRAILCHEDTVPRKAGAQDTYTLDPGSCINCSICTSSCPTGAWKKGREGYILWIGGTMGKIPRLATRLPGLIASKAELYRLIDRSIEYYRLKGVKKERFGHMIDRIGVETVKEEILHGRSHDKED